MHMLLFCLVLIWLRMRLCGSKWFIYPYPSELLHMHWGQSSSKETLKDVAEGTNAKPQKGTNQVHNYWKAVTNHQELSWCQLCHHWWQCRLSWQQPALPPVMTWKLSLFRSRLYSTSWMNKNFIRVHFANDSALMYPIWWKKILLWYNYRLLVDYWYYKMHSTMTAKLPYYMRYFVHT